MADATQDHAHHNDDAQNQPTAPPDSELEMLRDILFSQYRQQIAELETELDRLEGRVNNKDALIAMVSPIMVDAIRRIIRDAREEMVEALYPIIGQTVVRAVTEAIRDLARNIDAQMRQTFDINAVGRRLRAQASGVSSAEMVLRESLPFNVAEVFLIHRESGLLLWHISRDPDASSDSDLISGMLSAIRDFVSESFGQGQEGDLDEIEFGNRRILIETAKYAYLAVVLDGTEPPGFRAEMRERVIEVDYSYERVLRDYEGDPAPLAPVEQPLRSLITGSEPRQLTSTQKRVLAGLGGVVAICLVGTALAGFWGWQAMQSTPTPIPVVVEPSPTPTHTFTPSPTATPRPTSTPTPTSTSTATATPTPTSTATATPTSTFTPTPSPVTGLMTGNVWLREGPSADTPRLGVILERNQPVEILSVTDNWYKVRWAPQADAEVVGWVPNQWVGTLTEIPAEIITPISNP